MQRSVTWWTLILAILAISMSCENFDDDFGDRFGDESLEDRAFPVVATYQAENRTAASGCQVADNHTGFSGSGFIDFGGNRTWIEWNNVNISQAGDYKLVFRYAVGGSPRQSAIIVNGSSKGNLGFVNSGSWTSWKTNSKTVALRRGNNTVRVMANTGNGGPNLDSMEVQFIGGDDRITARGENQPREGKEKAFDGRTDTKWLDFADSTWIQYEFGGGASKAVNKYKITSANDYPERDPRDWRLKGSNNGSSWTTLDTRTGQTFSARFQKKTYTFSNTTEYRIYRLEIVSNLDPPAANSTQLAEIEFIEGDVVDECPDDPNKTEPGECGCGVPEGSCDGCTNVLLVHEKLVAREHLCSENGKYEFGLTSQGELVIRQGTKTLWSAGTFGSTVHLVMQGDGNLVVYNAIQPRWDSKTNNNPGATLKLENDGRVVIRRNGAELWSAGGDGPDGVVDATTLRKKIMAGYQGWFYAKNDGGYNKWNHWCNNKKDKPRPENVLFDMWPDLREFPSSELYPTGFTYSNGSNAGLYSAHNASTVGRHMKWCQDYGIDGVFVQRFLAAIHDGHRAYRDKVLLNVKAGAEKYGRVFVNMWDINSLENKDSGWHDAGLVDKIKKDWMHLVDNVRITSSNRYLKHNGKPLVAIWGVSKMEVMDARYADDLVDWFRKDAAPKYRASVMLGVTNEVGSSNVDWRSKSSSWQNVFRKVDVISPWTVGRFKSESGADSFYNKHIKPDKQKCDEYGVDYFPVVFPGFSACQKHDKRCNDCPRNGGKFLWRQFYNVMRAGSNMVYVAMFDEVDEGTAIYKIAENQKQTPKQWPSNHSHHEFIVMDADGYNLPSDWYLRLTGEATKMLRNEIDLTATIPIQP